ncbi:hypothetical protein IL38_11505 [Actinopolyspora erythraea]|uniref:Glycosyltransferase n=1 Tax=Actinopolyspora erythraea TaxID=414996 RepID=A0ABR4X514_9ACTN|nr:hypothetical protein IL38_11505 [Actinopolyspora erythraea]
MVRVRILFSAIATHGHCYPLLPLAAAAREAGHEVVVATGGELRSAVHAAGAEFAEAGVPVFDAFDAIVARDDLATPDDLPSGQRDRVVRRLFGGVLPRRFVPDVRGILRSRRFDLVVYETGNPGAALAASLEGTPAVCHGFGRELAGVFATALDEPLRELAEELGVALPTGVSGALGNTYLDIFPPSLQDPGVLALPNRIGIRSVPFAEPGELPGVVTAKQRDRPLVYLTLGTAFGSAEVLRTTAGALAEFDVDLLVAAGPRVRAEDIGELPGHVTVASWFPQAHLIPRLDLVVHHGGAGTTLAALASGVPQLFLPQGADQFDNAASVVAAGAGSRILPEDHSGESVAAAVKGLLGDRGTVTAARSLAAEIAAAPGPSSVVDRLSEMFG